MQTNDMIILRGVNKRFGTTVAADNIDLNVRRGEIFGFLGPNGAGKTTTIRMMTGILTPDSGELLLNGYSILTDTLQAKNQFGYVSDDPNLFLRLKGIEYLTFLANIYNVDPAVREQRINELATTFELQDALADKIQSYSHGMRQKLVLIGALIHNPPLWILDEPMTGLDPRSSFHLKNKMREHADSGNTVFFSTHVLDVAEKVCDRLAIIDKGRILFCGTIAEMRSHFAEHQSLEQMFLDMIDADQARALDGVI